MLSRVPSLLSAWALGATLVTVPAFAATAHAAPSSPSAAVTSSGSPTLARAAARVPAKPTRACRQRLVNPRKAVPSARFASCVVAGMKRGHQAVVTTRHTPGVSSTGATRFGKRTDASVKYSDGSRLVMLKGQGWYKPAGKGWVRPGTRTEDEIIARSIVQLWNGLSSDRAYASYLRASTTGWKWSGKTRSINGVRARQYVGTVTLAGMTFSHYSVWLDAADRPIRIQSTGTNYGVTVTSRQDFKKWGKKVSITPPTRR